MPLYNNLKVYRAKYNVSQDRLGKATGISRQAVAKIENGHMTPSITVALKLAKVLNCRISDIFCYIESESGLPEEMWAKESVRKKREQQGE